MSDEQTFYLGNLFSLRYWYFTTITSMVVFGVPLGLIAWIFPFEFEDYPGWLTTPLFILTFVFIAFVFLLMGTACRFCGKNLRFGFDTCPRCGRDNG